MCGLTSFSILFLVLFSSSLAISALSPLHFGPKADEKVFLYGRVNSTGFKAELKRDVILWDVLHKDGASIHSCSNLDSGDIRISIDVSNVNMDHFLPGATLIVGRDHVSPVCGPSFGISSKVDKHDPMLFYHLRSATGLNKTENGKTRISIRAEQIHGRHVLPTVEVLDYDDSHRSLEDIPDFHLANHNFLEDASRDFELQEKTNRQNIASGNGAQIDNISIFPGATVRSEGDLRASMRNLKILRLFNLEVEWSQKLAFNITSKYRSATRYKAVDTRNILREQLPKELLSKLVPLFSLVVVKAVQWVDLVRSIEFDERIEANLESTHEEQLKVNARVFNGIITVDSLLPPGLASKAFSKIEFGKDVTHNVTMKGFYGYKMGLDMFASFGFNSLGLRTDLGVGLKTTTRRRFPPFPALPSSNSANGFCSSSHEVRLDSAVIGKDLTTHILQGEKEQNSRVHIKELFNFKRGTVCR